ncbi:MAG: ABC transporter permease [Deltaproteobacteria bacterium]|jgi:NitT/TauT family transport system permease protein|nr:ABC transporter permease [Deltaproteobacteria bacterium]
MTEQASQSEYLDPQDANLSLVSLKPLDLKQPPKLGQRFLGFTGIIVFLALWQILPWVGIFNREFIPTLFDVLSEAGKLVKTGELFIHIASSLERALVGLVLAIIVAIPAGVALAGLFPRLTRFLTPLLALLGNINPFALFPLFILLFGVGEPAKYAIIFWSSLFPMLNFTILGVTQLDPTLLKAARSMGADRRETFWKVILPGSLPSIFTGFRLGATTAFLFLIAAEMLSSNSGMGYLVHNSSFNYLIPKLYVGVLGIAILGMLLLKVIDKLEALFLAYKEETL